MKLDRMTNTPRLISDVRMARTLYGQLSDMHQAMREFGKAYLAAFSRAVRQLQRFAKAFERLEQQTVPPPLRRRPRGRRPLTYRRISMLIVAVSAAASITTAPHAQAFGPTPIPPPPELADVDVTADCAGDVTCLNQKIAFLFYAANAQGTYTSFWYDQWMRNDRIVKAQRRVMARRLAQIKKDRAIIRQLRTSVEWRLERGR